MRKLLMAFLAIAGATTLLLPLRQVAQAEVMIGDLFDAKERNASQRLRSAAVGVDPDTIWIGHIWDATWTAGGTMPAGGYGPYRIGRGPNFVTRQGTNRFLGSAYEYYRHPNLNSNYWFNTRDGLDRNDVRLNQFGSRVGGPIVIPGVYNGSGKAFFFVHHEELRLPNNASRTRTVLHPRAAQGWLAAIYSNDRSKASRSCDIPALNRPARRSP